jgi:hypothetical protein
MLIVRAETFHQNIDTVQNIYAQFCSNVSSIFGSVRFLQKGLCKINQDLPECNFFYQQNGNKNIHTAASLLLKTNNH